MPNTLSGFVWINVMSQWLFSLHTELDAICGPLHSPFGVIHSLWYPLTCIAAPPSLFSSHTMCHRASGNWATALRRDEGEDFTLTSDSSYMCLTDCYKWMNDTVDVTCCCKTVMGMQEGVFLTKSKTRGHKVEAWTQNQKQHRHKRQIFDCPNCVTLIHLVLQEPSGGKTGEKIDTAFMSVSCHALLTINVTISYSQSDTSTGKTPEVRFLARKVGRTTLTSTSKSKKAIMPVNRSKSCTNILFIAPSALFPSH